MGRCYTSKKSLATGKSVLSTRKLSGMRITHAMQLKEKRVIQNILDEIILPLRKGEFYKININNTINTYINKILQTKNTNIVHNFILESISAKSLI